MIDFSLPTTQQAKFTAKTSELTVNYNVSEVGEEGVFDNVVFGYIDKGKKIISFPNDTRMELLPNTIALGTTKFSAHVAIKDASIENPALCFELNIAKEKAWKVIEKINESYSIKDLVGEEQKLPAIEVYFGKAGIQIFDTIKTIQHLLIEDVAFKDYWIDLKIEELILHCLQTDMRYNLINGYQKNCIPDHPLAFAIKYIRENLYKEIELGTLSNKAFMSKARVFYSFLFFETI